MATKFAMTRDINGYNGFGLSFTDTAFSTTIAASTDTSVTVPSIDSIGGASTPEGASPRLIAVFTFDPGQSVWVALNATASVPAGASFSATSSELNPAAREVKGGDVIHFISATANVNCWVGFYWLT